jgi:hypothetical protein
MKTTSSSHASNVVSLTDLRTGALSAENGNSLDNLVEIKLGEKLTSSLDDFISDYSKVVVEQASLIARSYPHIFDKQQPSHEAINLVSHAVTYASDALDAFGTPDIETVSTKLKLIAVTMKAAYEAADFNRSFASALSFIRRSTLIMPFEDVTRQALNALILVLKNLQSNPMLDLMASAELINNLEESGWKGDSEALTNLLSALLPQQENEKETLK